MDPYLADYKKPRPAEVIPGYSIDAIAPNFDKYQEMAEWAFDGDKENTYKERAFFADSEEEARKILEEYQTYLSTNDGGLFLEFLEWMSEQSTTRDDFIY